ncbi:MAG TPA: c-type cytochrome [Vicinamibacterales bacterium]|nr:c-type cytochrome [Vicinamibacterales bacterium]
MAVNRPTILILGFAVVYAVAALSAQKPPGDAKAKALKNPVTADAASIAAGKDLYELNCEFCHGPKGLGDGSLAPSGTANLADDEWKYGSTDGEIFTLIKKGVPPDYEMPPAEETGLSDTEIWHLVNYVRSLGPKGLKR